MSWQNFMGKFPGKTKNHIIALVSSSCLAITIIAVFFNTAWQKENRMEDFRKLTPPKAAIKEHGYEIHGTKLSDPYAWLRDSQWKSPEDGVKDQEILNHIKAENSYTDAFFNPLKPVIQQIFDERRGFLPKIDESVPVRRDDYFYYTRQSIDQNYPVYLRKKGSLEAQEEIIMDVNVEAEKHPFFNLGGFVVSPSHQLLAYSVDTSGNEFFELKVRDLTSKGELSDVIPSVAGRVIWNADSSGFYYVQYSTEWRPKKLFHHKLGMPHQDDMLVHEEKDALATIGIGRSFDRRYLIMQSGTKDENSIHILDLAAANPQLTELMPRQKDRLIHAEHDKGKFYLLMNDTGPNFRLVAKQSETSNWQELLPHNPDVYLTGITPYEKGMILTTVEKGLSKIAFFDLSKNQYHYISMPGETYDMSLTPTAYEDTEVRFSYSALNKPNTVYARPFEKDELKVLKVQEIPSGFDESLYTCKRIWAEARDGTKVPISLAYRHDMVKLGEANPVMLYGYGSYGYGIDSGFRQSVLSIMNRGFIYAIAHIRGGDDLGYQWYLDGKMQKKKNTFNDFIDAAEYLIKLGYTKAGMISAMGGSAGGMLMGAVVNDRPDLFKAIIAHVPFVDVMNTMLDESLPLTPGEFVEWGNPKEKASFDYILSYSPYDNIKRQDYPAIYVTGGLTDPRVTYWEPTKWVARLRDYNTGKSPILLKMHMGAGHAGGSKRDERLREDAEDLAFLLKIFGKVG